VNIIMGR